MIKDTSKQSWLANLPWVPVRAAMFDYAMTLAQVPARKFYWDAKIFTETIKEVFDYYGFDTILTAADIYNHEVEALGAKLVYSDNAMPTIDSREPLVKEPKDLLMLKTPDFYHDGRLPYSLDCTKLRAQYFGVYSGIFCGAISLAVGLRSYPLLIRDMRKQPSFAHELLTFVVDEVLVPFAKVQKEYCKVPRTVGADAWASVPNLSVKDLKEWAVPYNQRLRTKAKEFGIDAVTVSGEYCEERPDQFNAEVMKGCLDVQVDSMGAPTLSLIQGRWHEYPLEPVREYTAKYREQGTEVRVTAGVYARLLRDGPISEIVKTIKRFINTFARDHELTIHLANIPFDTPPDHVHAAVAAVHTFGRKPIADNLDEIEFKPPKRESFQEWRKIKGI